MLINDDCRHVIDDLDFDLVVTSPPYKDEDNFSFELIEKVFTKVYKKLPKDSLCFVNFGHLANFKTRPFKIAIQLEGIGFELKETFIWVKNKYTPLQGNTRVNNLTEYVFMFAKGNPKINRKNLGIEYIDKYNSTRYGKNSDIKCSGNFWDEDSNLNVWKIKYENLNKQNKILHQDRFPIELPLRCLLLADYYTTVLDPFGGSGTTGISSLILNKNFILIEKNIKHYETILNRFKEYKNE